MSKEIIIVGRKNGKTLGLLRRVLELLANAGYDQAEVVDELAKSGRYSQKVFREINESLTIGNSKENQKN